MVYELGEEFCPLVSRSCFEDSEDGVEDLARDGHDGLEFGLVSSLEQLVKGFPVTIVSNTDERGHVERSSQMAVAMAADARRLVDGSA